MENDINIDIADYFENCINLSEIGKYDKFINFKPMPNEYSNNVLFPKNTQFRFTTNELKKEKLTKHDMDCALDRMYFAVKDNIEKELNELLKEKIKTIRLKAEKKIEKLKEKPRKKLEKLKNFDILSRSFQTRQDSEEVSLNPSLTQEQSQPLNPSPFPQEP